MGDRSRKDEPLVGEALADAGAGLGENIDPALMERLDAWFSAPATSMPAPSPPSGPAPDPAIVGRRLTAERAAGYVDRQFLAELEAQGERAASVLRDKPGEWTHVDDGLSRFDLDAWGLGHIGEPRDYTRPDEIAEAVRESAPQAVLRDLHRPVRYYGDVALQPTYLGVGTTGAEVRELVREAITQCYKVPMGQGPRLVEWMQEDRAELLDILAQPWEDSKPEKPRPLPSSVPTAEDLKWFGPMGNE